jgi:antitoxin PrlF
MPTEAENIKSTKGTSRLTQKHQVTIPKDIREKLGLEAGDTVIFEEEPDGEVRIRKITLLDFEFVAALEETLSE